jgi:hypothetical protein
MDWGAETTYLRQQHPRLECPPLVAKTSLLVYSRALQRGYVGPFLFLIHVLHNARKPMAVTLLVASVQYSTVQHSAAQYSTVQVQAA